MIRKLEDLITDKISGEWGNEGTPETGVKVIRTANFTNDGVINFDNLVYREIDPKKIASKQLQTGDIIIEKSGGSPTQPVGRVVFFDLKTNEPFLCNNFTSVLRPNKKLVYPKYLFYRLFEGHKEGRTLKYQNKTTGIINLKLENYLQEKLDIPDDLQDQIHIANILSKAEALISQRKESIRLLDEFLKSTFLEMFGDPSGNKKKFPIGKIRDVVSEVKYGTSKPAEESGAYPYLRMNNITSEGYWDFTSLKHINIEDSEREKYIVRKGDLVFNRTNSKELVGKTGVFNSGSEMVIAGYLIRVRTNEKANPWYLWGYLNSIHGKKTLLGMCKSIVGMANINAQELQDIRIIIPPIKLQTQFAHIVEKTEALKTQYQNSLQELENLYSSLSQKAFKGELNLKEEELAMAAEPQSRYGKK